MDGSCMDSCWDGLEIILRAAVPRDRGLIITFKTWPANYKEKSELQITLNDLMCNLFITKTSWLSQITLIEWQKPICTTPLCQHLLDPCWHGDRYIIHDHTGTALSLYNLGFRQLQITLTASAQEAFWVKLIILCSSSKITQSLVKVNIYVKLKSLKFDLLFSISTWKLCPIQLKIKIVLRANPSLILML